MINGMYLTLMVGPGVPVSGPRELVESLTAVQVQVPARGPSGFELTFSVPKNSPLVTLFMLSGGVVSAPFRVVLVVSFSGVSEVIADGIMTDHQMTPGTHGAPGTLSIRGTDLTALMDLIPFDGFPYPAAPPEVRSLLILAKYAAIGIIPMVIPPIVMEDRKSTRLNSSHSTLSRMPSSA